ncbi:MAG: hypothetical protein JRJ87_21730 [Deltaproteobacteria bacterium]|nr:hypothetical protein [Deltaproteobacteria bacterium]
MKKLGLPILFGALLIFVVGSCTDTNIYHKSLEPNVPDRVTISGSLCTDDPAQRQFPVKIMFLVDTFGEPQQQRQFAVEDIINRYVASDNYTFAIIKFAGEVKQLTDGYTKNLAIIKEAAADLGFGAGACVSGQCRDWLGALSLASSVFTGDLLTTNPGTRSRTRYVFIFVASGPPNPTLATASGCNEKCRLVQMVEEIVDFGKEKGAAEVAFHTVQVDSIPGECQGTAEPQYCNSSTPCPSDCAGTEECQMPQRLCADDRSVACSDGDALCASLGLGACTPEWLCDGDFATGCDGDSICANSSAGSCDFVQVCNNDVSVNCVRDDQCCPTFPCNDPQSVNNDYTAELLSALSFKGSGKNLRFSIYAQLNFWGLDFDTTESIFVKKAFFITNTNAKALNGETLADSDGDGMSDIEEWCYGEFLSGECKKLEYCDCEQEPDVWSVENPLGSDTDPAKADTDGDGLNDLLEMQFATVNLNPLRMDLPQACFGLEYPYKDRDGDGLNDCEENLLGTDKSLFDTDRDGYPDMVEFKAGTNYLQPDHLRDSDMDGLNNGQEIEIHLDPLSNDMRARSGEAYRYKVIDEGLRVVPYVSQPHTISGIELTDVSGRSTAGAWTIYYYPAGSRRGDGSVRDNPAMAWGDPGGGLPGMEVELLGSGTYLVYSGCSCVRDCPTVCNAGDWCNPSTGVCSPDQCEITNCLSTERCESASGMCRPDCTLSDCDLGQRCDPILGTCLTDRCLNVECESGRDCDPEAGVCTGPPCEGWGCPDGMRLNEDLKPPWVTIQVDESQLPLSGFWCDGTPENDPCQTDADCPPNTFCRIRETVVVGLANKNCISFKVKNIKLVETLEVQSPYGPGYNNIFAYFAQTPLDNPYAYSIFRAALVQVRFVDGQKEPDWAEIPLGDGDFFAIKEK